MDQASWQKAKDVLYDAQRLPAPQREAYVRKHFKDRPDLCDEVLALLPNADVTDGFSVPIVNLGHGDELADLQPSVPVGHYTILGRLGRGGMGQVFLALDEKLRRRVALKCLLSRASLEADRDRILSEARAAAAITHPNVAAVYEVIEDADRAFMAMEFVDGHSLGALLARGRLPAERGVEIGLQLVGALGAAHASDIVHGDLKPANVMLTADGSAKVLDFGVARIVRGAAEATTTRDLRTTLPAVTMVGGTPGYMSPEQLRDEPIDARSDLYSLGVVLFEMVTGRRPYLETDVERLREAVKQPAPRADHIARGVPSWLADFIARSLESAVTARFQSASEMKEALEAVRQHVRVLNRRELILKWIARIAMWAPLVLLALELTGLTSTVAFNWTFGRNGPNARFGRETLVGNIAWGVQAIIPTMLVAIFIAVVFAAIKFVLSAMQMIGPLGRIGRRVRAYGVEFVARIGLNRPIVLAQALAGIALVTLFVFFQANRDVIFAWTDKFDDAPAETLLTIGEGQFARIRYEQTLDVAISLFAFGLYRVIRLRSREGSREGRAALAVLVGAIAIMVLLRAAPFRTFHRRDLEHVDVAGGLCYVGGESGNELLVLCPASPPPRNRIVRRDDPDVRRLGTTGNVFSGLRPSRVAR
jgi:tRNA A-37 threonylcarbamoyl transferase component Bud32